MCKLVRFIITYIHVHIVYVQYIYVFIINVRVCAETCNKTFVSILIKEITVKLANLVILTSK